MSSEPIVNIRNVRKPGHKKRVLNIIITLIVFIIIIGAAYIFISPERDEYILKDYKTENIKIRDAVKSVSVSGKIVILKRESITAVADGICIAIPGKTGDSIENGQTLMILDSEILRDEKIKLEKELKKVKRSILKNTIEFRRNERNIKRSIIKKNIEIEKAEKELVQERSLYDLKSITLVEFNTAKDIMNKLKEENEDLKLNYSDLLEDQDLNKELITYDMDIVLIDLNKLNQKIDNLNVNSDFSGTLLDIKIKKGDKVENGEVLLQVGDLNTPYIETHIPVKYAEDISIGSKVVITYEKRKYEGNIYLINSVVTEGSKGEKLLYCEIEFNNNFDKYILGSSIGCEIVISDVKNQLTLNRGEFLISGKNRFVYVVTGDKAIKRSVKYGVVNNTLVSILSGVKEGEEIIISSYDEFIERDIIDLR